MLSNILTSNSPNKWTYVVSYEEDNDNFNYIFNVSGNNNIQPSLIFYSYSTYGRQLGFNIDGTYNFVSNVLKSVNPVILF